VSEYVIRGGAPGKARLGVIGRAHASTTLPLLQRAGVREGLTCLDVGCGGGDVTFEMARVVGPGGRVVGVDLDDEKLALARQEAQERGIANVEFKALDVRTWEPDARPDMTYARFVLTHLPAPLTALQRIVQSTKAGGAVVVEDIDYAGNFSYPPCAALAQHVAIYREVVRRRGGDADIGPRLPELFGKAGLTGICLQVVQPVLATGEAKFIHALTTRAIADAVVAEGIATRDTVDALTAELDAFAARPDTLIGFPRIFQVWGFTR
jgi:SAM-dependent methyltransferase